LMEVKEGLPMNMEVLYCTLEELGENIKTVTKEIFKYVTLNNIPTDE